MTKEQADNDSFRNIVRDVLEERVRQDEKWGIGFYGREDSFWLTILAEEFGEVARAIIENDEVNLHEELIQCAAVLFSWLEFRTPKDQQNGLGLSGRRLPGGGIAYA